MNKNKMIAYSLLLGAIMLTFGAIKDSKDYKAQQLRMDETTYWADIDESHPFGDSFNKTLENVVFLKTTNYQEETDMRLAVEQACYYIGADVRGIMEQCQNDLLGIAYTETHEDPFNCSLVGDLNWGGSYGCFQINARYHPQVSREEAEDPYWASIWTAKRLVNNGYFTDRDRAIRKHNGSATNPQTLIYLTKVNNF